MVLRLALASKPTPSYAALGKELGLTASETHAAVERACVAQLAIRDHNGKPRAIRAAQFVTHWEYLWRGQMLCFRQRRLCTRTAAL